MSREVLSCREKVSEPRRENRPDLSCSEKVSEPHRCVLVTFERKPFEEQIDFANERGGSARDGDHAQNCEKVRTKLKDERGRSPSELRKPRYTLRKILVAANSEAMGRARAQYQLWREIGSDRFNYRTVSAVFA